MTYRSRKGEGSIHGWSTRAVRDEPLLIYGAHPGLWVALAVVLIAVTLI